jgi:hypothetical protein
VRKVRWLGLGLASAIAASSLIGGDAPGPALLAVAGWVGTLFLFFTRSPRPSGGRRAGAIELRNGLSARWLFPTLVLGPLLTLPWLVEPGELRPRWVSALAVVLAGLWTFMVAAAHVRFRVSAETIERIAPWPGRTRRIPWASVIGLRERGFKMIWEFVLVARGRQILRIPEDLDGIGDFAALALEHVPASALDAQPGLRARLETMAASVRVGGGSGTSTLRCM